MARTNVVLSLVTVALAVGCGGHGSKDHSGRAQTSTGAITTSDITFNTNNNTLTSIAPARGPATGGTVVTLTGQRFAAGTRVEFGGVAATEVTVVSATRITCKSPAHAAGLVDVVVTLPAGTTGRLNNGFTFEGSTGAMARVADYGDPTPGEQELLELINRARRDPVAEGRRLNLDFSAYPARPPLTHNEHLGAAALGHVTDMADRAFYGHLNPDGVNANGRILATPYELNDFFSRDPSKNQTESIGAANGNRFLTPQDVHDTFMTDAGVNPPKHREIALSAGAWVNNREVGIAHRTNLPTTGQWVHFVDMEYAYTRTNRPMLLGVAFDDPDSDGVCRVGEGRANVTVTLSHASGFTLSTQTRSAGGFAFEVLQDGDYTLTIDGQRTTVRIAGANVKVDLRDRQVQTY